MDKIKSKLESSNILNLLQNNKEQSKRILKQRPELVKYVNNQFLDKEFIKTISHENPYSHNIFNFLPSEIITKDLILYCMDNYLSVDTIKDVLLKFSDDKEFMIQLLTKKNSILKYMPDSIKDDFDLLYSIAKNEFCARHIFMHTSDRIKNTKEYILKFVSLSYNCIEHVIEKFRKDKDVILCLLKYNWYDMLDCSICLYYIDIPEEYLNDEEIAYYAIGVVPFFKLPKKIRDNKDLIKKAINRESYIANFIPLDLLLTLGLENKAIVDMTQ